MRKSLTLLLVAYAMSTLAGAVFAASENSEHSSFTSWYDSPRWKDASHRWCSRTACYSAKWKDNAGGFVGTTDTNTAQTRPYEKPMNSWYDSPRWKDASHRWCSRTACS